MSSNEQLHGLILNAWQIKVGGETFFKGVARRFPARSADLELLAAAERSRGRSGRAGGPLPRG